MHELLLPIPAYTVDIQLKVYLQEALDYLHSMHTVLAQILEYSTKQQLYNHLPLISQTIQVRGARYAEHY